MSSPILVLFERVLPTRRAERNVRVPPGGCEKDPEKRDRYRASPPAAIRSSRTPGDALSREQRSGSFRAREVAGRLSRSVLPGYREHHDVWGRTTAHEIQSSRFRGVPRVQPSQARPRQTRRPRHPGRPRLTATLTEWWRHCWEGTRAAARRLGTYLRRSPPSAQQCTLNRYPGWQSCSGYRHPNRH
jgi:hypothetical protein